MARKRTELQQLTIDGGHEVVAILDKQPTWGGRRKGAGRPKTSDCSHAVTIRVSTHTLQCLKSAAAARDTTVSALVKRSVLRSLEILDIAEDYADPVTVF